MHVLLAWCAALVSSVVSALLPCRWALHLNLPPPACSPRNHLEVKEPKPVKRLGVVPDLLFFALHGPPSVQCMGHVVTHTQPCLVFSLFLRLLFVPESFAEDA
jgi:hypothetical protein